jgi:glycosyltransferase involved in cell wall biosynthesis
MGAPLDRLPPAHGLWLDMVMSSPERPWRWIGPGRQRALSRTYVDLTDLVFHAIWNPTCGGIARVQLEVAAALVRSDASAELFSVYDGIWRDLRSLVLRSGGSADQLFAELKQFRPYAGVYPSFAHPVRTAKLLKARLIGLYQRFCSRAPRLTAADTLYIGGEVWTSPATVKLCNSAAGKGANLIVFLHDLIPILDPQFTGHDFTKEFLEILSLPAHFIVASPFTLKELERARMERSLPKPASVSVVPLADEFPGARRNESAVSPPKEAARLCGRSFVLCVGTVAVRKNHMMLLSVWEELQAELGDALPMLVLAGRRGWKAEDVLRRLDDLQNADRIFFAEAPTDAFLRWLYSACLFTVFPSVLEGWGLPVGESLWFGKACAASNSSSILAAGRDLCLYFSPSEPRQMKAAIRSLLDPTIRRSYENKIQSTRLRTWTEVAEDIKDIITRKRPVSAGGEKSAD